ncbi:MAG: HIT domain-containing protein [Candidatus Adiutrix sp.]|jgi:ATP adenylyltransferase|nr:HIT domain-containing protein [Candidatus Adiutrix sp.]
MEILWAPWRMNYITRIEAASQGCFLCLPPEHRGPDRGRLVLYSDPTALVMLNLYPYNNGHLLISPRRHIPALAAADETERLALMNLAARATEILRRLMNAGSFNLGINQGRISGGSVEEHLHLHVTPRYMGDSNYMTALGETRVISEHILATYDKLAPAFNE